MSMPRPATVLIVDDEPLIRLNLQAFLEDDGFDVLAAASAEQALSLLRNGQIDFAIVDMRLPGMDGNQLILSALSLNPSLKLLIHTGSVEYCLPSPLLERGLTESDIWLKPVADMSQLVREISSRLSCSGEPVFS